MNYCHQIWELLEIRGHQNPQDPLATGLHLTDVLKSVVDGYMVVQLFLQHQFLKFGFFLGIAATI